MARKPQQVQSSKKLKKSVSKQKRKALSLQDSHRSSERNSHRSSPERPDRSQERISPHRSQERTSPHRSLERTSRQSSRSSRQSNSAPDAVDQSDEDLQFVSHRPGIGSENFNSSDVAAAANPASILEEKFTASPKAESPNPLTSTSRPLVHEAPVSRVGDKVKSPLLPHATTTLQQLATKHPQQRNQPGLPVDPSHPATVHSRLPPAGSPAHSRRVNALEEDEDVNLAGGTSGNSRGEAAQTALLQRSGDTPLKPPTHPPAKVEGKEKQGEGKTKLETPAGGAFGNSAADILAALVSMQA